MRGAGCELRASRGELRGVNRNQLPSLFMTTQLIALGAFLVVAATAFVWMRRRKARRDGRNVMLGLRAQILHLAPTDVGIQPVAGKAWGVVMDTTYPGGSASLVSLVDGTASLYFSSGGGVIGGQAHEQVASAAIAFVGRASAHLRHAVPAADEELPPVGHTRFFILTADGTKVAEALENDLGAGRHELSPLFYAGQEVITQLRLMSEAMQAAG